MVLHSLAAVLLWLNVVVVAAVVVFVVGVQDRNCWLALLAVGVWFIVNFMPQLPTKRSQMGTTSRMFFLLGLVAFLADFWGPFWEFRKVPFLGPFLLWLKAVVPFSGPKNGTKTGALFC